MTDTVASRQPEPRIAPAHTGLVLQVNVSRGGVPKLPIESAHVDKLGLEGDGHDEETSHGGPYRAVCLLGIEAIERVKRDGHPIVPGGVGENLTTSGIEWSRQAAGTRVEIGSDLVLELTTPVAPCRTTRKNFTDGHFARISIKVHPDDSRMYARVVAPGRVRPGDVIRLQPPDEGSLGALAPLLDRLDAVEQESDRRLWRAASAGGLRLAVIDDGHLTVGAAPDLPGPLFNRAGGLRRLPNLLPRVLEHFRKHGVSGWLPMHDVPWEGAEPDSRLAVLSTGGASVADAEPPDGVTIGRLPPEEWEAWVRVVSAPEAPTIAPGVSRAIAPHMLAERNVHVVAARAQDVVVGVGTLHVHGRVGLMCSGVVLPAWRGHGIQRALIAARARLAGELGCDIVTAQTGPGSISERSLLESGFQRQVVRDVYRFDPEGDPHRG